MALLTVAAVWVAVSVPLALLAGRLLHATNPGLVSEIEAYLRRGRRRPLRRIAGMTATFLLFGGAAASATVATSRIPVVRSVTEWAFDEVTGDPPASSTAPAPSISQQAAGTSADVAQATDPATPDAPAAGPEPIEPRPLTELLLEGALAAELDVVEVVAVVEVVDVVDVVEVLDEPEPGPVPVTQVTAPVGSSRPADPSEPQPAADPAPAEEPEPTTAPEPEPTAEPAPGSEPEPAPTAEPEPAAEPEPTPQPEPEPVEPEVVDPEPLPLEPEPVPVEPLPTEPEPVLLEPEPEPIVEEPVYVAPEVIQPIPISGFPDLDPFVEPEPAEPLEAPN